MPKIIRTIELNNGTTTTHPTDVYFECGSLAVTRSIEHNAKEYPYRVTHLPTTIGVRTFKKFTDARKAAKEWSQLALWNLKGLGVYPPRSKVRAIKQALEKTPYWELSL